MFFCCRSWTWLRFVTAYAHRKWRSREQSDAVLIVVFHSTNQDQEESRKQVSFVYWLFCCIFKTNFIFIFATPTGRHTTSWRRTGENKIEAATAPLFFLESHVTRWRQPIGDDSGKPFSSSLRIFFSLLVFSGSVEEKTFHHHRVTCVPLSVRDPCHTLSSDAKSPFYRTSS